MNEETIKRLMDYSKKLHDRRFIPNPSITDTMEVLGVHRAGMLPSRVQLSYALGQALDLFDTANPKDSNYEDVLEFFNRCISMVVANGGFLDNEIVTRFQDCQTKCSELEKKLKECETFRDDLVTQRDYWKTRHDLLAEFLPKKHDEVFESDVKDG
ncbi:MAG: hypothetical protein ACREBB_04690 [Nitrosotalea sp.]